MTRLALSMRKTRWIAYGEAKENDDELRLSGVTTPVYTRTGMFLGFAFAFAEVKPSLVIALVKIVDQKKESVLERNDVGQVVRADLLF